MSRRASRGLVLVAALWAAACGRGPAGGPDGSRARSASAPAATGCASVLEQARQGLMDAVRVLADLRRSERMPPLLSGRALALPLELELGPVDRGRHGAVATGPGAAGPASCVDLAARRRSTADADPTSPPAGASAECAQELAAIELQRAELRVVLPIDHDPRALELVLSCAADLSGVALDAVVLADRAATPPSAPAPAPAARHATAVPFTVVVRGTAPELDTFFARLAFEPRLLAFDRVRLEGGRGGALVASCEMRAFVLPEP